MRGERVLGYVAEKATNAIEPRICLVLRTICANFVSGWSTLDESVLLGASLATSSVPATRPEIPR
jgi:hypothetical protein